MSKLGAVVEAVEKYESFVLKEVKRARSDEAFGRELSERWAKLQFRARQLGCPCPGSRCRKSTSLVRLRGIC